MTIKAVIFDFDGTIIDTETLWFEATKEILSEKFGLDLPLEVFSQCVGTTDEALFQYLEVQTGLKIDPVEIDEMVRERLLSKSSILEVREGVREKLAEARDLGLKIGLASSSSRAWVEGFLTQFHLWEYFEVVKTKEDVAKVKPDPALYLMALDAMGVEPGEAVAIEDSANGALAAIAAGMKCIVIPNQVTTFLSFHEKTIKIETFVEFKLADYIS